MYHVVITLLIGIAIGLSAAAPIGPVNFEIIRRNLTLGLKAGIGFGLGACTADLCYLIVVFLVFKKAYISFMSRVKSSFF